MWPFLGRFLERSKNLRATGAEGTQELRSGLQRSKSQLPIARIVAANTASQA
jgi:hypothetical protein